MLLSSLKSYQFMIVCRSCQPMKWLLLSLFLFSSLSFDACIAPKDEAMLEMTEDELGPVNTLPNFEGLIAMIYNDDIFLYRSTFSQAKRITFTPNVQKNIIALSHDHSKIAYQSPNRNPVVIDTFGQIIEIITDVDNVRDLGWSPDDRTLYMLVDNELKFSGPAIDIPPLDLPNDDFIVTSFHMAKNGNYVFIYDEIGLDNTGTHKVLGIIENGSIKLTETTYPSMADTYNYARWSVDGSHLLEGKAFPSVGNILFITSSPLYEFRIEEIATQTIWTYDTAAYKNSFSISPNGQFIAYGTYKREGPYEYTNLAVSTLPLEFADVPEIPISRAPSVKIIADWK